MENKKALHPMYWIPTTWFAMGLPFVAVSGASSIMYKNMGVSDTQIAFWTSLIMIPWTLKPLWGPFLELYKTRKFFVYITQIFTGILFGLVGLTLQLDHFFSFSIAILTIIALSGATHDTAADGVYLNELSAKQQAKYVGWQGAFYNVAKVFSGGALVYFAGQLEREVGIHNAWMIVMFVYGAIMLLLGLCNMRVLPSTESTVKSSTFKEGMATLKDVIITFFQKKHIWFSLAFIVFYRFAEGQAIKIIPLFFKSSRAEGGLELSTSQIGLLYGVFGAIAFVLGSIVAGNFIAKSGLNRKSLLILCTAFNIPFAAYAFLAVTQPENLYIIGSAVVIEYFGYGFGFVGLILFIMQNIAPGKYKMAHYAFGSGLVNLGFMIPSMISGWLSDMMGYKEFFIWVMIATIPAFIVTWLVPLKKPEELEEA
ncbi:MFS transporter [Sphingobacterium yanglingense]|uniref:PAT family beta-lactamase induction signal transducer AmpG n=1 Tax=Sphingobacterium yanglingense TaxID=1437280 RepID=A0A4V3DD84_9SPHI|nr:MFS transporter [Sphingobacterium yanglingense]TDQ75271.1 PAT family beta-lactamase induction signal transducer AmpG [Sphingobacterium yanglingense]